MRCLLSALSILAVLTFMVSPVSAEDTVEAHLIIEAFDGCGCPNSSAPLCPAPHELKWPFDEDWWTYELNSTGPSVASETPARRSGIPDPFPSSLQVTFSESVTGVAPADLQVDGKAATSVTGSGAGPYTFSGYSAPSDGAVKVQLFAGAITGASGAFDGDWWSYQSDSVAQWVTVASTTPAMGSSIASLDSVQVTFSEAVINVTAGHLRVNGSAATSVTGSGAGPYEFTGYGAPADGTVRVELRAESLSAGRPTIRAATSDGCNCHAGSTNNPHPPGCAVGSWPHNYPNPSYWAEERKIDQDWSNQAFPLNFLGNNSIKNGSELDNPPNEGSQGFQLLAPQRKLEGSGEFGCLSYISPDNPQDKGPFGAGRIHVDQMLVEFNTNFADIPLPDPIAGQPVHLEYDIRRDQDQDLVIVLDAYVGGIQPAGVTWTLNPTEAERTVVPDDSGKWHTYRIGTFSDFPDSFRFLILFWLRNPTHPDGYPWTAPGDVQSYIDNVKLVYRAEPFPENCSNKVDDDGDTLIDCADPDCDVETDVCPCNRILVFDPDRDTDVDQEDFAEFQNCFTGSGYGGELTKACKCYDVTGPAATPDGSVDQQDFGAFDDCSSGPEITASASCDGLPDE